MLNAGGRGKGGLGGLSKGEVKGLSKKSLFYVWNFLYKASYPPIYIRKYIRKDSS